MILKQNILSFLHRQVADAKLAAHRVAPLILKQSFFHIVIVKVFCQSHNESFVTISGII